MMTASNLREWTLQVAEREGILERIRRDNPSKLNEYVDILEKEGFEHRWVHIYKCRIWRNSMGAWCGYVTIPKGHKMYGKHHDDVNIDVHGGLTYGAEARDGYGWTFGFDTAHAGDLILGMRTCFISDSLGTEYEKYRDKEYVIKETNNLAKQLYKLRLRGSKKS